MEIDIRFPTKLDSISDAPEPLRSALVEGLSSAPAVAQEAVALIRAQTEMTRQTSFGTEGH